MPPLKQEQQNSNIMTAAKNRDEQISSSIKTIQEDSILSCDSTTKTNENVKTVNNNRRRGLDTGLRRRIKRSRSAPPLFDRKNSRRSLVQQHFKIDKESKALLPGVPVHDNDFARDMHDFFNLIILVPIVVLNVLNWNWDKLLYGSNNIHNKVQHDMPFVHAWTGEYFQLFFWTTVAYFAIDLLWVCIVPKCVKSPSTIIQHHILVGLYLIIPYYYPSLRFAMGLCMGVELNTWFLIARRVFNKQGFSPWQLEFGLISVRIKLISICFYITWIGIRCGLYPYLLYVMIVPMKHYTDDHHVLYVAIALQIVFCFLNAKWSLQLLNSKIKQWKNNEGTKIASGL